MLRLTEHGIVATECNGLPLASLKIGKLRILYNYCAISHSLETQQKGIGHCTLCHEHLPSVSVMI